MKKARIPEGGAMRGMFPCGVMDVLMKSGWKRVGTKSADPFVSSSQTAPDRIIKNRALSAAGIL